MRRILIALILVGALAGLFGARKRYEVEARNRKVGIAVDYAEARTLAQVTGEPLRSVLARFKAYGVTAVGLTEDTVSGLEAAGAVRPSPGPAGGTVVLTRPDLLPRLYAGLTARGLACAWRGASPGPALTVFVASGAAAAPSRPSSPGPLTVMADYTTLRPFGLGIDPAAAADVRGAGIEPIGRVGNFAGASPRTMDAALAGVAALGCRTVIFQGLEVLGYRDQTKEAAAALDRAGLMYGQVEFGKQKGDDRLSAALRGRYVRVHSIGEAEMGTLDKPEMVDRFVRAARERNIRLCYIRMLTSAGADPVQANADCIREITAGIARGSEMAFGPAHLFDEPAVPAWVLVLIGAGVGAGLMLVLLRLTPLVGGRAAVALLVVLVACAGCALAGETGRKLVALLAALVFPTLACLRTDLLAGTDAVTGEADGLAPRANGAAPERARGTSPALRAIGGLAAATAVTSAGILSVVGLLASRPFMLKANQFLGIKAAHAIPILLIGAVAVAGLPRMGRPWAREWARMRARVSAFLSEPTRVGMLLLAIIALLALALVVARTGNEPGVGVSGLELKLRSLMDRFLPVRPRTKEFLVGHPAFVLALALWFRGRRRWALPLYVVGVLGQVSILNTFCHIHTPLMLSLTRDVAGLVIGAVFGLVLFWAIEWAAARSPGDGAARPPSEAPRPAPAGVEP